VQTAINDRLVPKRFRPVVAGYETPAAASSYEIIRIVPCLASEFYRACQAYEGTIGVQKQKSLINSPVSQGSIFREIVKVYRLSRRYSL
jgi:hypothetical protein